MFNGSVLAGRFQGDPLSCGIRGQKFLHVKGTIEGSTTARLTQDGFNLGLPIVSFADTAVAQIAAATGTCSISVFAWG